MKCPDGMCFWQMPPLVLSKLHAPLVLLGADGAHVQKWLLQPAWVVAALHPVKGTFLHVSVHTRDVAPGSNTHCRHSLQPSAGP